MSWTHCVWFACCRKKNIAYRWDSVFSHTENWNWHLNSDVRTWRCTPSSSSSIIQSDGTDHLCHCRLGQREDCWQDVNSNCKRATGVCVCVCVCGILVSVAEGERKLGTQGERGRLAEVRKMWVMLAPSVTRLVDNSEVCFCYQPVRTARALTSWCGKGRHRLFPGYSAYKVSRDDSRGRVVRC